MWRLVSEGMFEGTLAGGIVRQVASKWVWRNGG